MRALSKEKALPINATDFNAVNLKGWNPKEKLLGNCRTVLYKLYHRQEAHEHFISNLDADGTELIKLRRELQNKYYEVESTAISLRESMSVIDEAITLHLEHAAYSKGYENAEYDITSLMSDEKAKAGTVVTA